MKLIAPLALIVLISVCGMSHAGLYGKGSNVVELNKANFDKLVHGTNDVWMVEFYAPWCGHCKNLAPAWEQAATKLNGIAYVGAVNCDEERQLCGEYGIEGFPTIKSFGSDAIERNGKRKKNPQAYNYDRAAPAIIKYAAQQLPNYVKSITEKNVDDFVGSELPKVFLFSEKKATPDMFKAQAVHFKDHLVFGHVKNIKSSIATTYGIESFPAIVVVNGEEITEISARKPIEVRKALDAYAPGLASKSSSSSSSSGSAPAAPPPVTKVEEIVDQATLKSLCLDKSICALAVMDPSNTDDEQQAAYLSTLLAVAKKQQKKARFAWIDGVKHESLVQQLDISTSFPQVVVLSARKKGMAIMRGGFTEEKINSFVEGVVAGKKRMYALDALPSLSSAKDEL